MTIGAVSKECSIMPEEQRLLFQNVSISSPTYTWEYVGRPFQLYFKVD